MNSKFSNSNSSPDVFLQVSQRLLCLVFATAAVVVVDLTMNYKNSTSNGCLVAR